MGFNFFKTIVAVLIALLLTGTVVFAFFSARVSAADQMTMTDVEKIREALKLYHDVNSYYPTSSSGVPKGIEAYLNFYPTPQSKGGECSASDGYTYERKSSGTDYTLVYCLQSSGVHTATSQEIR